MKKSVAILTYHALHNYGATLQAFALQNYLLDNGFNCTIINFRPPIQKHNYKPVYKKGKSFSERVAKKFFLFRYRKKILKKYQLFESFISEDLHTTAREFKSLKELESLSGQFDYYIAGSDQIWNPFGPNFDWAFYLPFVGSSKRVAYAPSMVLQKESEKLTDFQLTKIKKLLSDFKSISVREEATANHIKKITGELPPVVLDPVFLLNREKWDNLAGAIKMVPEDYIFYYSPNYNKRALEIAKAISKKLTIKVVTSIAHSAKFVLVYRSWEKVVDSGPKEFLNLVKHAKLVVGHSFHLAAFSIIFEVPFFITDGLLNKRTNHLLKLTKLEKRSILLSEIEEKSKTAFTINFDEAKRNLHIERKKSIEFLRNALK